MPLFESIDDLHAQAGTVLRRRYGVIEATEGEFRRIRFRPFPKMITLPRIKFDQWLHGKSRPHGDRCLLFYNQPLRFSNFLALRYVVSTPGTGFATFRAAVAALDEVARIKRTDALLCDAANLRISDRLLRRWGWSPHKPQRFHRNYVKRYYGRYPEPTRKLV